MSGTTGGTTIAPVVKAPARKGKLSKLPAPGALHGLTRDERLARGKAARAVTPRKVHGAWQPAADRFDPVALLEEQAVTRVPELVPIRHGRMLVSPFAFYRGAAVIMAADLAGSPDSGYRTQLCGDAHLSNFGLFASPERKMLFDINDFDETLPGPWEWDVKRLAASFEVAGRDRGFSASDRRDIVRTAVRAYRETMRRSADMGVLDVWYAHLTADDVLAFVAREEARGKLDRQQANRAEKVVAKARTRVHARSFDRLVGEVDGQPRIIPDPPLIVGLDELVDPGTTDEQAKDWVEYTLRLYRTSLGERHHPIDEFRHVDTARKVVGVGSVGTRCWIDLFVGLNLGRPLFLQTKEAPPSVLERFLGRSQYQQGGRRVVEGQRLMQAASDIFLGWLRMVDVDGVERDYYVRQLHDWKGAVEIANLRVSGALLYAQLCGATLARAHARAGDRLGIAAYLGKGDALDRALADFAVTYADQNERDYEAFAKAVETGRIAAETGR